MRQRNRLSAAEWQARLNREMARVLSAPASFPPATLVWARWRRAWLAESGSPFREPAPRAETAEGDWLAGPSSRAARAGGKVAQFRLRLAEKKVVGCQLSAPGRLVGPSSSLPRAGEPVCAGCLAADPKTHLTGGDK